MEGGDTVRSLRDAFSSITLGELLQVDFFVGIVGLAGGIWIGYAYPGELGTVAAICSGLVGAVVGAVIAGVAVQTAFLDDAFLRKIRLINKDPVHYLVPFLFTAVIGIAAMLLLISTSVLPPGAPGWLVVTLAGCSGFSTFWAVTSLGPALATLVQFVGLRMDALDVPDDIQSARSKVS